MDFITPYLLFCGSSVYSLIQNMESMGWVSFWKVTLIDPHSTFALFFSVYVLALPIIALLNILASFTLNKKLGILSIILWLLPGLLSVFGIVITSAEIPDAYHINSGSMYVGETRSTLGNVFIAFLLGWSFITLLIHAFKIKSKFKECFDHIWYITGLAGAVIFVVDSNTAFYKAELQDSENNINKIFSIAAPQLRYAQSVCVNDWDSLNQQGISGEFCQWIKKVGLNYFWISEGSSSMRQFREVDELRNLVPKNRLEDIRRFNKYICSSQGKPEKCSRLSIEIGRFSENYNWPHDQYALAIEPLNEALLVYWKMSTNTYSKLDEVKNTPNSKWFFYMILGFIVGGKVANSSRSLSGNPKPVFRHGLRVTWQLLKTSFQHVRSIMANFLSVIE